VRRLPPPVPVRHVGLVGLGGLGGLMVALTVALSGCTSAGSRTHTITSTVDTTVTRTATHTSTPPTAFTPKPATTVTPLPPGQAPGRGEVERACPYILSSQEQGPSSMADLEGDRVYRTTVLTGLKPVGCRFYFWSGPYEAIAEIAPQTFATAQQAHDAMVLTARAGTQATGYPNLLPGIDAISYRTKFFGADCARDWACAFAKGNVLVIVRTQRTDTSLNGRLIAKAIAPKI
jgi:hypothetical protein